MGSTKIYLTFLAVLNISLRVELDENAPESWDRVRFLMSSFIDLCKLPLLSVETLIADTSGEWKPWALTGRLLGSDSVLEWNGRSGVETLTESNIFGVRLYPFYILKHKTKWKFYLQTNLNLLWYLSTELIVLVPTKQLWSWSLGMIYNYLCNLIISTCHH